jgi:hypothetical protein
LDTRYVDCDLGFSAHDFVANAKNHVESKHYTCSFQGELDFSVLSNQTKTKSNQNEN